MGTCAVCLEGIEVDQFSVGREGHDFPFSVHSANTASTLRALTNGCPHELHARFAEWRWWLGTTYFGTRIPHRRTPRARPWRKTTPLHSFGHSPFPKSPNLDLC